MAVGPPGSPPLSSLSFFPPLPLPLSLLSYPSPLTLPLPLPSPCAPLQLAWLVALARGGAAARLPGGAGPQRSSRQAVVEPEGLLEPALPVLLVQRWPGRVGGERDLAGVAPPRGEARGVRGRGAGDGAGGARGGARGGVLGGVRERGDWRERRLIWLGAGAVVARPEVLARSGAAARLPGGAGPWRSSSSPGGAAGARKRERRG
jgi:hypothetical protein